MSRNNDVFQVLVTAGNQAVLPAGNKVSQLAPGQIGVFDFNTNLSFVAAGAGAVKNYYLAVGLDTDGDGVTDDITKSAGSHIQKRNLKAYAFRGYTPGQPQITVLSGYTANCETEYGIKLEIRNQEIYRTQGYNQFTKYFSLVTSCCDGCEPTCPSGDANEITKQLVIQINNDPAGLLSAEALARQDIDSATVGTSVDYVAGDVVSAEDVDAIMAYNATLTDPADYLYTDLQITTITQKLYNFANINLKYFYPRETVAIISKVEGFTCTGTLTTTQEATFEEGSGYDIKQLEYEAKGWTESPYRVSTINGVADEKVYNTIATAKYDKFDLTYDQDSIGAWEYFQNFLATSIAVPTADTTTRDGLVLILDALSAGLGFDQLSDDVGASNPSTTVIEKTEDKIPATDGIA